jgi:arylsulfatase A-like enzyme
MRNKINRRNFLQYIAATAAGSASLLSSPVSSSAFSDKKPLNVLFICVDDLRPELGCFGAAYAQTPNIDKLAKTGVCFTNHFVQVPTCGASRYALLTGRSPARSGGTGNHSFYKGKSALNPEVLKGAQSMPELFRRNGYHTVCIGKISHQPDGRVFSYNGKGTGEPEIPHGWDELATPYGRWERGWGMFFAYKNGRHREDGKGNKDLMEFIVQKDEDLPDGLIANAAIDKLKELKNQNKPFFMGVGFYKPHLPFVGTRKDWDAMKKVDVPLASHQEKPDSGYWHKSNEFYKYNALFNKTHPLTEEAQLKSKQAYLACARYSDRQIGKVLKALEDQGLAENTIVVLWGDHGWHLGDSQIWGKHTPFERAVHSPLLIRAPGLKSEGSVCSALVETLDIYPTVIDLCSLERKNTEYPLDGKSLKSLLYDPEGDIREAALSYWRNAVSVRTKSHRLIVTKTKNKYSKIELYDIRKTPDPVKNIKDIKSELVQHMLEYAATR